MLARPGSEILLPLKARTLSVVELPPRGLLASRSFATFRLGYASPLREIIKPCDAVQNR